MHALGLYPKAQMSKAVHHVWGRNMQDLNAAVTYWPELVLICRAKAGKVLSALSFVVTSFCCMGTYVLLMSCLDLPRIDFNSILGRHQLA